MLATETTVITAAKGAGIVLAAVLTFFGIKSNIEKDVRKELKLKLDLVYAEIEARKKEIEVLQLENIRLAKEIQLRLVEKEHELMCSGMQKEIAGLKLTIEKEFIVLHKRMDKRRITNGSNS